MEFDAQKLSLTKNKLVYIGNPMCSWCWGITPHLQKLIKEFSSTLDFELVLGGLRPGGGDNWTSVLRDELRVHWTHVHEASGQPFNFDFLKRDSFNYDTEPPSRAVRIVRDLSSENEFPFFKDVQYKFYVENDDPSHSAFYQEICEKYGLDTIRFEQLFNSNEYKQQVLNDFFKAKRYGVRAFPTVILDHDNKREIITYGYSNYVQMKNTLLKYLSN